MDEVRHQKEATRWAKAVLYGKQEQQTRTYQEEKDELKESLANQIQVAQLCFVVTYDTLAKVAM